MAIETSVNIDVNVDGTATVKQAAQGFEDLGDAVAKTQREAEALALQFGINDQRTQEAIKRAGQYKGQLEQLDQAVEANKGGIDQMFRAVQGVAAGFEIAAGATALFGSESEDLNKVLIRVQGAMVFAQGLRDLKEFVPAIKAVNSGFINMIKTLNGVKIALAATGIGAIVAVIGLFGEQIGELFDKLKEKFKGFTDSIGLTKFAAREAIKEQEALVDSLNRELAVMEARGDSESALFKQRLKIAEEEAKLEEQRLAILSESEDGYPAQQKAALDASNNIIVTKEQENKRLRDLEKERVKNREEVNKQLFDLQAQEIQANKDRLQQLTDLQKQYQADSKDNVKADFLLRFNELSEQFKQERELLENALDMELITEAEYDKLQLEQDASHQKRRRELELQYLNNRLDQQQKLVEETFSIITNLTDAFTSNQAKQSEEYFKVQKAFNIAQVLIDTYFAAQKAYNSQMTLTPDSPIRATIAAAAAVASGLARVAAIKRTEFNRSAPQTSFGQQSIQSATIRSSSLPQTGDILTQNRKVYVLEGDITRTQQRVASNQSVSVLGG
jgi:hypothetical protein